MIASATDPDWKPAWVHQVVEGSCGVPIEMGLVGDGRKYVTVPCSRSKHDDPGEQGNHEVRDYFGRLIAWTGRKPDDHGPTHSLTYLIQEEPWP